MVRATAPAKALGKSKCPKLFKDISCADLDAADAWQSQAEHQAAKFRALALAVLQVMYTIIYNTIIMVHYIRAPLYITPLY